VISGEEISRGLFFPSLPSEDFSNCLTARQKKIYLEGFNSLNYDYNE